MSRQIYEGIKSEFADCAEKDCCAYAFLSGAIRGAGELGFTLKGFALAFRHQDGGFICKVARLAGEVCGEELTPERAYIDMGYARGEFYVLSVPAESAAELLEKCAIVRNRCELVDALPDELVGKKCCKRAFLRGLFLACGYLRVPAEISDWHGGKTRSGYALEFNMNSDIVLGDVVKLLSRLARLEEGKVLLRKKGSVVYIKNADAIGAVLAAMGSGGGALALHEIMAERQMKNDVNRANNFDLANIDKSLASCEKQTADIKIIDRIIGIDNLPHALAETCLKRLAHPDAGLAELGSKFDPPVGKSCINHRMRKIAEIAAEASENAPERD